MIDCEEQTIHINQQDPPNNKISLKIKRRPKLKRENFKEFFRKSGLRDELKMLSAETEDHNTLSHRNLLQEVSNHHNLSFKKFRDIFSDPKWAIQVVKEAVKFTKQAIKRHQHSQLQ